MHVKSLAPNAPLLYSVMIASQQYLLHEIICVNSETPESEVEDEGRIHDSNDEGQSDMDSHDAIDDMMNMIFQKII